MVGGIVAVAVGSVLAFSGALVMVLPGGCPADGACSNSLSPGIEVIAGGLVGLAVGIPLIVYGAQKVPVGTALASPLPAWAGAPGGRGWVWRF